MKILPLATAFLALAMPWSSAGGTATELRIGVEEGAVYDGILDGFPGIALLDGKADLPGNPLGVALRNGVTEERGVAEFPLASLPEGAVPDEAVLLFNIDDVLSTFGPGTEFSGRAAATIFVHVYAGDGALDLADFGEIAGRAHRVDTNVFGTITDAVVAARGPLLFEVDITDDVAAVVAARASHLGIVWRTEDSPTGTSLDDLGADSAGPPGIGGAILPFVTLRFAPAPEPTATATPTAPMEPTATPVPPTPTVPSPCAADCNGDAAVTVDEIVALVGVALGNVDVAVCPAGDTNGDGTVTVDEIVVAVNIALGGCL